MPDHGVVPPSALSSDTSEATVTDRDVVTPQRPTPTPDRTFDNALQSLNRELTNIVTLLRDNGVPLESILQVMDSAANTPSRETPMLSVSTLEEALHPTAPSQNPPSTRSPELQIHTPTTATSPVSHSSATPDYVIMREGRLDDIPKFSDDWKRWQQWEIDNEQVLGANGWAEVILGNAPLDTSAHQRINSTYYWKLLKAVTGTVAEYIVSQLKPPEGTGLLADGRTALHDLLKFLRADDTRKLRADQLEHELTHLFTGGKGGLPILEYSNKFSLAAKRYDHISPYGPMHPEKLVTYFRLGILDQSYASLIRKSMDKQWTLAEFQHEIRKEVDIRNRRDAEAIKRQAAAQVSISTRGLKHAHRHHHHLNLVCLRHLSAFSGFRTTTGQL